MYFRSCGTISGFWTGGCSGNTAKTAQLASLHYSFTVDTSTNLMSKHNLGILELVLTNPCTVMALPIKLTWSLQMPRSKKVAILLLFASGFVCILFACLRVAQVAINAAKPEADGQPLDPTWLAIWGMVECSIGTSPSFPPLPSPPHHHTHHLAKLTPPPSRNHRLLSRLRHPDQRLPHQNHLRLARLPQADGQQQQGPKRRAAAHDWRD
jgi:hypothetical protein